MARFSYKDIIKEIGTPAGFQNMTPKAVTTHHTAVATAQPYNVIARLQLYTRYHGSLPYHIYISANDSDPIFITQYVNTATIHNANWEGNRNCIAICVEGNFEVQNPTAKQIQKYKQVLDDIADGKTGFAIPRIDTRSKTVHTFSGVRVYTSHYHNQVAQPGNGTACAGRNLIPKVVDYVNKGGNVTWPELIDQDEAMYKEKYEAAQKEVKKLQAAVKNKDKAIVVLENELKASKKAQKDLEGKITLLEKKVSLLEATISTNNDSMKKLQSKLSKCEKELKDSNDPRTLIQKLLDTIFKREK